MRPAIVELEPCPLRNAHVCEWLSVLVAVEIVGDMNETSTEKRRFLVTLLIISLLVSPGVLLVFFSMRSLDPWPLIVMWPAGMIFVAIWALIIRQRTSPNENTRL